MKPGATTNGAATASRTILPLLAVGSDLVEASPTTQPVIRPALIAISPGATRSPTTNVPAMRRSDPIGDAIPGLCLAGSSDVRLLRKGS